MIAGTPGRHGEAEIVFLAWLLGLPDGADVADAALAEVMRIDRTAGASIELSRLRALFAEAAEVPLHPS